MRLRATRQVLAVVAVTTALCADRLTQTAPASRTPVSEMASRLVMRLAQRLRRMVAAISPWQVRERIAGRVHRPVFVLTPVFVAPRQISPFQFRLPPPGN